MSSPEPFTVHDVERAADWCAVGNTPVAFDGEIDQFITVMLRALAERMHAETCEHQPRMARDGTWAVSVCVRCATVLGMDELPAAMPDPRDAEIAALRAELTYALTWLAPDQLKRYDRVKAELAPPTTERQP